MKLSINMGYTRILHYIDRAGMYHLYNRAVHFIVFGMKSFSPTRILFRMFPFHRLHIPIGSQSVYVSVSVLYILLIHINTLFMGLNACFWIKRAHTRFLLTLTPGSRH